tara:strand:+ start:224 stop:1108 length:885 start_codon:yes stop_codon:yes gene_type:complete
MPGHNLKPLNKLKFESVGEEFIYLHKEVSKNNPEIEEGNDSNKELTIEYLREEYSRIVNEGEVEEKYEKNSVYWTVEQERAIASFISEKDADKKEKIFREDIYKSLKKLVENIIFTYKLFRSDVEIRELQEDCMSFLITKMDRYDPSKGTRAFAFFGTIAKHYLMGEKKISYKNIQSNVSLEGSTAEISLEEGNEDRQMDLESEKVNNVVFREIIKKLDIELENPKILPNDKKVMEAIIFIFNRHEVINIYNKNLLYHLIKERTDLQTKEITYSLTRIRSMYKEFKEDFLKDLK